MKEDSVGMENGPEEEPKSKRKGRAKRTFIMYTKVYEMKKCIIFKVWF
jgi:hypothetical protein